MLSSVRRALVLPFITSPQLRVCVEAHARGVTATATFVAELVACRRKTVELWPAPHNNTHPACARRCAGNHWGEALSKWSWGRRRRRATRLGRTQGGATLYAMFVSFRCRTRPTPMLWKSKTAEPGPNSVGTVPARPILSHTAAKFGSKQSPTKLVDSGLSLGGTGISCNGFGEFKAALPIRARVRQGRLGFDCGGGGSTGSGSLSTIAFGPSSARNARPPGDFDHIWPRIQHHMQDCGPHLAAQRVFSRSDRPQSTRAWGIRRPMGSRGSGTHLRDRDIIAACGPPHGNTLTTTSREVGHTSSRSEERVSRHPMVCVCVRRPPSPPLELAPCAIGRSRHPTV